MEILSTQEYLKYCASHPVIFSQSIASNGIVLEFEALEATNNEKCFSRKNISGEAFIKAMDWFNNHSDEMCNVVYNAQELDKIIHKLIDIRDKLMEEENADNEHS